ncbi:MAG: thioesterase, partial [Actinomycetota bacterium]|nr:thioesterase [Actinomycetota bacterium]
MAGRVYTHRVRVDGSDVGPQGRAHLDSIADWLQAVAFADGLDAGLGTAGAWILRRTSLRIVRLPRFGEDLSLRTWCGGLAASVAERRTSIEGDGGSAIEAEAVWVHIDPASRRPARFPPQFLALYAESAGGRRPRTKLRHPAAPPADAAHASWSFTAADVPKRAAIMVSRYDHCLLDLLWRARRGELHLEVGLVISNHADLAGEVRAFGVPYVHVPVTLETKPEAERRQLELLGGNFDLVVMARYMQILSGAFLEAVGMPVINIH